MANVRIITDSSCELPVDLAQSLNITVLPWRVRVGPEMLVDGPTLRTAEFHRELLDKKLMPSAIPPDTRQYGEAFERLAATTDQIIAITPASKLARCYDSVQQARRGLLGRCEVHVLDATFIGRTVGILVQQAALLALQGVAGTDIVRQVSGLIPHAYLAIYTDSLATMTQRGLVDDRNDEIRGTASYRPLLLVEGGQVIPLQRSRKRGAPSERIIEFVGEFRDLSQLYYLHNGHSALMAELRAALAESPTKQAYEEHLFGPVFASLVGLRAFGVAALES
jgi:DegV family protein with EDD domain